MEEEPIVAEETVWEWVVEWDIEEVSEDIEEIEEENKDNVNREQEDNNWKVENE